jgi:predicted dienelactone hydrolase
VAVVHPPRLGEGDAAKAVGEISLRPADLSATLDALAKDKDVAPHLAPGKTAAVGFFLGGTAALQLAGATLDAESYRRSCDRPKGPDCQWFAKSGVDLHKVADAEITGAHHDPRIGVAVAVNPELAGNFAKGSLVGVKIPFRVINLGPPGDMPPHLDASGLSGELAGERYVALADVSPFDAFSQCTPKASAILREEGEDDTLCPEGQSGARAAQHARIAEAIAAALTMAR